MISFDEEAGLVVVERAGRRQTYRLDDPEAFAIVSDLWLRAGWCVKHPYTFTWLGRPVIQLPEDLVRMQELVHRVAPDVIIETGVAHGGSLVFYAGLCKVLERGRVIGIDVEIRSHNRAAIEAHPLAPFIELVEGDSVAPDVVAAVSARVGAGETVLVVLDSDHSHDHVLAELEAYAPLVTPGSYVVAMDGYMMAQAVGLPRGAEDWAANNPNTAVADFVRDNAGFVVETPAFAFDESLIERPVSYSAGGFVRRVG
ncbi:MAG: putative cephalosporin hydroxylase [Solirubrobacterales bacterium]|nr:putative cephalosporin hydroxylase [Solirubrobacterales bacterium]